MLRLYNGNHVQLQPLTKYSDLCLKQSVSGEDELSFTLPASTAIQEEWYVRTADNEYVVKEISKSSSDDTVKVLAKINVEDLKGTPIKFFETVEKTIESSLSLAFSYVTTNSWIVESSVGKRRTIRLSQKSVWDIIQEAVGLYMVEIKIDAINHKVYMETHLGEDKGAFFTEDINLKNIQVQSDTHNFWTRIYPVGADGMTIAGVNNGVEYVENHTFSDKVIAMYWEDNRYTVMENMKADAIEKLETYAVPAKSYSCEVVELAKIKGLKTQDFNCGDMIYLMSRTAQTKQKLRIVDIQRYLEEPERTTCTLSTQLVNLTDYVSQSMSVGDVVSLVTTSDGKIDPNKVTIDTSNLEGGIPKGGAKGEALVKATDNDFEVTWKLISGGGGLSFEEIYEFIQIGTNDIQDGAITNAKIGVAAIGSANIMEAAIGTAQIDNGAITNAKIADAAITSAKIGAAEIEGAHIKNAAIDTVHIHDEAVDNSKIKNASIDSAKIADAAITSAKIDDAAITEAKIADAAITTAKIVDAAITSAKIDDLAVTTAKIANGAIDSAKIGTAAITDAHIKDASITSAKILALDAGLITTGTLATERLLLVGTDSSGQNKSIVLTLNEINGAMKLSSTTIDGNAITEGTVTNKNIMAGTITSSEIAAGTIKGDNIAGMTITGQNIAAATITADKLVGKSLSLNQLSDEVVSSIVGQANNYTDEQINQQLGKYLEFNSNTGLTIGNNSGQFNINVTDTAINFNEGTKTVAYINNNSFEITNGTILEELDLGNYAFVPNHNTGNLRLVWKGDK